MSDLISREAVLKIIDKKTIRGKLQVAREVQRLPSAQTKGHWTQWNYPGCEHTECSVCKTAYDQIDLYIGGSEYPNYCPNCGAYMRGMENCDV